MGRGQSTDPSTILYGVTGVRNQPTQDPSKVVEGPVTFSSLCSFDDARDLVIGEHDPDSIEWNAHSNLQVLKNDAESVFEIGPEWSWRPSINKTNSGTDEQYLIISEGKFVYLTIADAELDQLRHSLSEPGISIHGQALGWCEALETLAIGLEWDRVPGLTGLNAEQAELDAKTAA